MEKKRGIWIITECGLWRVIQYARRLLWQFNAAKNFNQFLTCEHEQWLGTSLKVGEMEVGWVWLENWLWNEGGECDEFVNQNFKRNGKTKKWTYRWEWEEVKADIRKGKSENRNVNEVRKYWNSRNERTFWKLINMEHAKCQLNSLILHFKSNFRMKFHSVLWWNLMKSIKYFVRCLLLQASR